ncbi:MAG: hypothetical protein KJ666_08120, partial [Bacteroidetes bacterium]|nr:hypothetical protein [Bacteroidota bacterium]
WLSEGSFGKPIVFCSLSFFRQINLTVSDKVIFFILFIFRQLNLAVRNKVIFRLSLTTVNRGNRNEKRNINYLNQH